MIPYKVRYSVIVENIAIYDDLSVYILLSLSIKFIRYGERAITYLDDLG